MKKSHVIVLAVLGVAATIAGCGYKKDPVPPNTVVPIAITDLNCVLEGNNARLSWTYPREAVNGRDLMDILSFDLYRAEVPVDGLCSSCPIPFGEPMKLPGGVVDEKKPTLGEFDSGQLRSGNKYFFKITSRISRLAASGDSNIVSFVYYTPAAAPEKLSAKSKNNDIALNWRPVTSLSDGSKTLLPVRYQVMRSVDGGKSYENIGPVLADTGYVDKGVKSGRAYVYQVKSFLVYEGETVDGSTSEQVAVNMTDTMPPQKVMGVTVVASTSNVRIFWNAVDASDLAGYRIYRRLEGEGTATMIGEVGATRTIFVDTAIKAETGVYYAVAAYDADGNEGELSAEVTTRY